jgi:hypothetical protein
MNILRKEKTLSRQMITNLTRKIVEIQKKLNLVDSSVISFQNHLQICQSKEIESVDITFKIQQSIYHEELIYSKNIITALSNIIDDIIINKKSLDSSKKVIS